jgi:photosystem II stability/assembly factor-like uncharacterized protein
MITTILNNISKNTIFTNNFTYIIVGEIHVLNGITLCIEDNTIILLRNGINKKNNSSIDFSTLIFDTGSTLIAKKIFIKSADKYNKTINYADNGGLIFLGSAANITYNSINSQISTTSSNFSVDKLIVEYLGSTTNNSITTIGVNYDEFNIKNIKSFYSGNIGLSIINSNIVIDKLLIYNPSGNIAIDNNNSIINIIKVIKISITNGSMSSLFNFFINSYSPYIKINKNTCVYLKAPQFNPIFNPLDVVSIDFPSPTSPYFVNKILKKQTYIFADAFSPLFSPLFLQSSTNTTGNFFINSIQITSDGTKAIAGSSSNTGLWYSTNGGQSWTQSSTNTTGSFNSVATGGGTKAIAGSNRNTGLWYSVNGGQSWTQSSTNTTGNFFSVAISTDGTKAIAVSINTGLWYSVNGGQTWTQSSTNTTGEFYSIAISADGTKAIAGSASDTGLWYSTNGGQSWTKSSTNTTGNFYSIAISADGTKAIAGSFSGNNTGLWYSTNGGQTWTQASTNTTGDFYSVAINTDGTKAIAGSYSNTGLWYSANGGQTWTQASTNTTGYFFTVAISADGTKVVAGSSSLSRIGVWYSNNSGQTYTQSSTITTGNWIVAINRNGTKAIVGSRSVNLGLWYST